MSVCVCGVCLRACVGRCVRVCCFIVVYDFMGIYVYYYYYVLC